jgi:hypothetical protein
MSGGDCPHMATHPAQHANFNVRSFHDGSCNHLAGWAFEKNRSPDTHLVVRYQVIVSVVPVAFVLSTRDLRVIGSPPPSLAWTDPLLITLRV